MYFEFYVNGRINSTGHTYNLRLWKEQDKKQRHYWTDDERLY